MKNKKMLWIGLGVVAVVGYFWWMNKNKSSNSTKMANNSMTDEEVLNATGQQIGTSECSNPNNDICKQRCEQLGGQYNQNGDRKCYKNGVAITTPPFNRGKVSMSSTR